MTSRPGPAVLALIAVLAVAGCTSSSPTPNRSSGSPAAVSPATSVAVRPAVLAAEVRTGLADVRSVHLALSTTVGTEKLPGTGDLVLVAGTLSQAEITQALPGGLGQIEVIITHGAKYAKLPSALTRSGKPWVRLSDDNSNPVVAQLTQTLDPILAITSPTTVTDIVAAASSVRRTAARTYRIQVGDTALPSLGSIKLASGLPVTLTLGDDGRPGRVSGTLVVAGEDIAPAIDFSDYNAPVTITAPPANQVDER